MINNKLLDIENPIDNTYGTSQVKGYSQEYLNNNMFSGSYNDLTNKPTIPTMATTKGTSTTNGYSQSYINDNVGVVDSGSNSNGNWVKFSDGTMICYRTITGSTSLTATWGSIYYKEITTTYSFAKTFTAAPCLHLSIVATGNNGCWLGTYNGMTITASSFKNFAILRPSAADGSVAYNLYVVAIGKWK